MALETQRDPGE